MKTNPSYADYYKRQLEFSEKIKNIKKVDTFDIKQNSVAKKEIN